MIRDRLVCGISNDAVRQRLLAKENSTLAACIKEWWTSETTASQVTEMRCVVPHRVKLEPADDETRILRTTTAPPKRSGWARQTLECRYCNRRHEKGKCPAFGQVCRNCGKRNHFAAACRQPRAHLVTEGDPMVGTVTVFPDTKSRINRVNSSEMSTLNAVYAMLEIQNKLVRFQIDSGASCNIVRQEDLNSLPSRVKITPTTRVLRMYDSSSCTPLGTCALSVKNPKTGGTYHLNFMVV